MSKSELKLLIADDDEGDRKQVKRAIQQAGLRWVCVETESMEQALALCEQEEFDCAIVDYHLPGQDGLEGISTMRARFAHLPIIMSTGQGDELVAADAIKRGASDYVPKAGVNGTTIHKMVEHVIEKSSLERKVKQQQDDLEVFARVLAHDLSAPAAAIQTFAARIAERLATGQPEKALEYAEWVIQTAARMTRLIETLHRYTTADARVAFEPVDMSVAFDAALANLQDQVQQSGSVVTANNLPVVMGNTPQLIQLLQNLIGNAIKFCDRSSPVVHVEAFAFKDEMWRVGVADNGIGIAETHFKKVFEPFVRLNTSAKRKGSGLGLATCKKIAERHGGVIWCESKPGLGTTFFFTLPAATLPVETGPARISTGDARAKPAQKTAPRARESVAQN
jgi:signal transduction histidine kinase